MSDGELMEELDCRSVQGSLWDYSAGALTELDRAEIMTHLGRCRDCGLRGLEVGSMRTGLRQLPFKLAPAILETRLQVLASRERSRLLTRRSVSSWVQNKAASAKLFFDHLLKPFAVPAAGGILASFFCFGLIVGNLHLRSDWAQDIPAGVFTDVSFDETSPFLSHNQDVLVELTVDSSGHVTDYSLPQIISSPEQRQEIGNLILYSTFIPATRFGQPIASKRYVSMNHITVKG